MHIQIFIDIKCMLAYLLSERRLTALSQASRLYTTDLKAINYILTSGACQKSNMLTRFSHASSLSNMGRGAVDWVLHCGGCYLSLL